jgi:TRAP-type mannitol/chloroaromatic compound transport system permease small subunit
MKDKVERARSKTIWAFLEEQDDDFLSAYDDPVKSDSLIKCWSNRRKLLTRLILLVFLLLPCVSLTTSILCCKVRMPNDKDCVSSPVCILETPFIYSLLFILILLVLMLVQADIYTKLLKFYLSRK